MSGRSRVLLLGVVLILSVFAVIGAFRQGAMGTELETTTVVVGITIDRASCDTQLTCSQCVNMKWNNNCWGGKCTSPTVFTTCRYIEGAGGSCNQLGPKTVDCTGCVWWGPVAPNADGSCNAVDCAPPAAGNAISWPTWNQYFECTQGV